MMVHYAERKCCLAEGASDCRSLSLSHSHFQLNLQGAEKQRTLSQDDIIATHYNLRPNRSDEQREASPIICLKKLHNRIKNVLIQVHAQPDDSVLDLACGKGGDLKKWNKAMIGYYVGVDIAWGSIEDARSRYNDRNVASRQKYSFPAKLICADCFKVSLNHFLEKDGQFDICSCQFALHYSWSTEQRARKALENVAGLLKPGGYFIGTIPDANVIARKLRTAGKGLEFGNSIYNIKFSDSSAQKVFKASESFGIEYKFYLQDAVDCPEWLVPFQSLKALAKEYGLRLVWKKNFKKFVHEYCERADIADLVRSLGDQGDAGGIRDSGLSADEQSVSYIYLAFVFQKEGKPPQARNKNTQRIMAAEIRQEDLISLRD